MHTMSLSLSCMRPMQMNRDIEKELRCKPNKLIKMFKKKTWYFYCTFVQFIFVCLNARTFNNSAPFHSHRINMAGEYIYIIIQQQASLIWRTVIHCKINAHAAAATHKGTHSTYHDYCGDDILSSSKLQ